KASFGGTGRRTAGLEIYTAGRYFTISGKHVSGSPEGIEERQAEIAALVREWFPVGCAEPCPTVGPLRMRCLSDQELIAKALRARSGARFGKLWCGDTSDYDGDHSRADAALCRMLAFWTGRNAAHVDRLFRMSGLMREKWNRKTGEE